MVKHQFGEFGGQYVPENVKNALDKLENCFIEAAADPSFRQEYVYYLKEFVGRPSPLYFAERMTRELGGAKVYLKREDLNHTGAHKINNTIGQILLAKRMGKNKIIAETGAGQHGVATATAAAMFGMQCDIYMGAEDTERQRLNVFRMEALGARVVPVERGTKTLSDAVEAAIEAWSENIDDIFYLLGSAVGPHPYPTIVREFQRIIGEEVRSQILEKEGRLPDYILACVGGGSNAIGIFADFLENSEVNLIGVEAAGKGISTPHHAATMTKGRVGVIHGMRTYYLADDNDGIMPVYSISAGLDYPGVGPEHSYLKDIGRVKYESVTDEEAIEAFLYLSRTEGILPALESSHAVAHALKLIPELDSSNIVVINVSGRGDKDMPSIEKYLENQKSPK